MAEKKDDKPADPPAEGEAPAKKKLPVMLIAGAAAGVLVLGGGGAGAYFMFLAPKPDPAAAAGEKETEKKDKKKDAKAGGKGGKGGKEADKSAGVVTEGPDGVIFYTMPDLVANIQTSDGRATFLKLKLTFELEDEQAVDLLEPNAPRLRDMFTAFLRELRPEDLQGSAGSYNLRMEILRRVNLVIAPAKVKAVLIEEMLVN
jgi:flagellar FliL protein